MRMTQPSADLAIRLARAAFNRALADADIAAIGPLLAANCVMVTGSDSAVIAGRKAQLLAWKREFSATARTIYTRTPDAIVVSEVEPVAMETGRWKGVAAGTEETLSSGTYCAKWRNSGGSWVIEAEIYVTLS
jgi:ketosteroid isomerase-like protein